MKMYLCINNKVCRSRHSDWTGLTDTFCSCNLDLDPMTLIHEHGLDVLKMYLHTKTEVSRSKFSKV